MEETLVLEFNLKSAHQWCAWVTIFPTQPNPLKKTLNPTQPNPSGKILNPTDSVKKPPIQNRTENTCRTHTANDCCTIILKNALCLMISHYCSMALFTAEQALSNID